MINFSKNAAWNLKPLPVSAIAGEVNGLLVRDEAIVAAFKTIRDQLIFTNKRIIAIDIQGITGKRKSYTSLPYSKIQYFTIQTVGFLELIPDSELFIVFASGFEATFEFSGGIDIGQIGRVISEYVL